MVIDDIRSAATGAGRAVECRIAFEGGGRAAHDIFVRTDAPHTLSEDPGGFLLGAFLPAWIAGERRVRVAGAVCPRLAANLTIAASLVRGWFTDLPPAPRIECDYEYRIAANKAALFLSGGVDSLAMVRSLVDLHPPGHPDRPTAAIVADYQHVGGLDRAETDARFARSFAASRGICADVGLDVVPLRSNLCRLNESMRFWMYQYHGAFLASLAHFVGHEFRAAHIASSYPATHLVPWGSHPALDPLYSSQHVRLSHDGVELSRLQKVRQLRDWPAALDCMYVCTSDTSGGRNCGRCEKCVRTKLHLLVAGALTRAGAFKDDDVTADEVRNIRIKTEYARICYEEALPGLRQIGRTDLEEAVAKAIRDYAAAQAPTGAPRGRDWLGRGVRKLKRSLAG